MLRGVLAFNAHVLQYVSIKSSGAPDSLVLILRASLRLLLPLVVGLGLSPVALTGLAPLNPFAAGFLWSPAVLHLCSGCHAGQGME